MSQVEQGKKIADKAASAARDSWNKGQAATEQTAQAGQEAFLASADGVRDFNRKVIEMAKTNTIALFDLALEVAGTKEPSRIMELWSQHTQKQFEILREQSQELTSMGQKVATASATSFASHRQELEDVTVNLRHSRPCLLGAPAVLRNLGARTNNRCTGPRR